MVISIAGLLICCALWVVARFSAEPLIVGLISSLAFGSTAIVILPAVGGSSPIIYVAFLGLMLATVALRPNPIRDLGIVFIRQPVAWVVLFLLLYTVTGAMLLPRLFAGQTTVFVPLREEGRIGEVLLAPVTGNITQSIYFLLSGMTFYALSILLLKPRAIVGIKQGFFLWAILHVGLGLMDLSGKLSGLGDVLAPIRTAAYSMLTEVDAVGFWRITGGYPEASTYGAMSALLLAFTFTFWRRSRDTFTLVLWVALLILLILSTSSTAYVAVGLLGLVLFVSITSSAIRNQLQNQDLFLIAGVLVALLAAIGIVLYKQDALDPLQRLFDTMVLNKASSLSAQERIHWNNLSLQSFFDTSGLGIGLGSSRTSSWIISVISQLGIVGLAMMVALAIEIGRSGNPRLMTSLDAETRITALSLRAAALTALATATISGAGADPGMVFFISLAVLTSLRATANRLALESGAVGHDPWHPGIRPTFRS